MISICRELNRIQKKFIWLLSSWHYVTLANHLLCPCVVKHQIMFKPFEASSWQFQCCALTHDVKCSRKLSAECQRFKKAVSVCHLGIFIKFDTLTNPIHQISATWYITKVRLCKNSVSVGTKQHVWAHTKNCHSRINNIRCLYSRLGFPLDATVPHPCRHFNFTPKTRYAKWLGPTSRAANKTKPPWR